MSKKQDAYYFENFSRCAGLATRAAELLDTIMRDFDETAYARYMEDMHEVEHAADLQKHELTETLIKAFITPIDREDIVQVSQNLDELVDKLEDVLIRMYCNRITVIRPDALVLAEVIVACCREVQAMMGEFAAFKRSKRLKEHIITINSLEEKADKLYIDCMYALHGESNVMTVIAWRDVYTYLEKCADTAEHIADIVESVVMKNS